MAPLKVAASHESTTGVGVDGFHPGVPLDMSDECRGRMLKLLHEWRRRGNGPRMPVPPSLSPTLIRWWEWLTALAVAECMGRHSVTWDACSKYSGGSERAGWEDAVGNGNDGL